MATRPGDNYIQSRISFPEKTLKCKIGVPGHSGTEEFVLGQRDTGTKNLHCEMRYLVHVSMLLK